MAKHKNNVRPKHPCSSVSHTDKSLEIQYLVGDRVLEDVLLKDNKFVYSFWRAVWQSLRCTSGALRKKNKDMLTNLNIHECL